MIYFQKETGRAPSDSRATKSCELFLQCSGWCFFKPSWLNTCTHHWFHCQAEMTCYWVKINSCLFSIRRSLQSKITWFAHGTKTNHSGPVYWAKGICVWKDQSSAWKCSDLSCTEMSFGHLELSERAGQVWKCLADTVHKNLCYLGIFWKCLATSQSALLAAWQPQVLASHMNFRKTPWLWLALASF